MCSTHLSDKELIEKLENVASLTNEDILSIEEASRGRLLLSRAQDMLVYVNPSSMTRACQSTLELPDHIARLSIALAPHKRLPPEILAEILRSGSEGLGIVELPPTLSDYRWVLGRVSSTWRRISRSIPFWETEVLFGPDLREYPYGRSCDLDSERYWKQLKLTIDILPKITYIRLLVNFLPPKTLAPYLAYVKALDWNVYGIKAQQELVEVLPPGALSHLESLRLYLPNPENSITRHFVDLFGESPHLRRLIFSSESATFLSCSEIPWSQLQSFEIDAGGILFSKIAAFIHTWVQLGQCDPFHLMTSLEHLTLKTTAQIFRILLLCKFPWQRLKTLYIHWCDELEAMDLPLIMGFLQKCTSLLSLKVRYTGINHPAVHVDPIFLPSLQTLEECCLHPYIRMAISSGPLRSLKSESSMALQDFYNIAAKCSHLTSCDVHLAYGRFTKHLSDSITLPHLTSLQIQFGDLSSIPTAIIAPFLTSLDIGTVYSGPRFFRIIIDFIVRSKMSLRYFSCSLRPWEDYEEVIKQHVPIELLREFLAILEGCRHVNISGVSFDQKILDEVASGVLLPHVFECLAIGTSHPDVGIALIRSLLEQRTASGRVLPPKICSYFPYPVWPDMTEEQHKKVRLELEELEERYHVMCLVTWAH